MPTVSKWATLLIAMNAVAAMRAQGADQLSSEEEFHGGTSGKRFWYGGVKRICRGSAERR